MTDELADLTLPGSLERVDGTIRIIGRRRLSLFYVLSLICDAVYSDTLIYDDDSYSDLCWMLPEVAPVVIGNIFNFCCQNDLVVKKYFDSERKRRLASLAGIGNE